VPAHGPLSKAPPGRVAHSRGEPPAGLLEDLLAGFATQPPVDHVRIAEDVSGFHVEPLKTSGEVRHLRQLGLRVVLVEASLLPSDLKLLHDVPPCRSGRPPPNGKRPAVLLAVGAMGSAADAILSPCGLRDHRPRRIALTSSNSPNRSKSESSVEPSCLFIDLLPRAFMIAGKVNAESVATACYAWSVPFEADVVVMARDVPDVRLVAEVKRDIGDIATAAAQLRQYMLARKCSLGLLVTPERTRIYRDTFADFTEGSVQLVGEFSTAELLDLDEAPADERALQEAVREWLDRMAAAWPSALPRTDAARTPVVQYLVPEVADGRVSSGSLG
jgi:hypothetical protein